MIAKISLTVVFALLLATSHVVNSSSSPDLFPIRAHDISVILHSHNVERAKYGIKGLRWNTQLVRTAEEAARNYSDKCITNISQFKHIKPPDIGENWAGNSAPASSAMISTMISKWVDEPNDLKDSNHYTQMLWTDTRSIGCAYKEERQSDMCWEGLWCHYFPSGNVEFQNWRDGGRSPTPVSGIILSDENDIDVPVSTEDPSKINMRNNKNDILHDTLSVPPTEAPDKENSIGGKRGGEGMPAKKAKELKKDQPKKVTKISEIIHEHTEKLVDEENQELVDKEYDSDDTFPNNIIMAPRKRYDERDKIILLSHIEL